MPGADRNALGRLRSSSRGSGRRQFALLTDRKLSSSFTSALDTVGLSFEVSGDFQVEGGEVHVANFGRPGQTMTVRHQLPGGGFVALGRGGRAWVEASAKRANPDGSNVHALPVPAALESMREAYAEAQRFCSPVRTGDRFELCRIVRLDPVRDFDGVAHVGELLDGLSSVDRDLRWKVRRYADPERNRAETLRVGPKSYGFTLYDKHVETRGLAPAGRLRFEARLHSRQLAGQWSRDQEVTMRQVCDVTEEKVARLTRATFDRAAFGREVLGRGSLAAKVFGSDLSNREKIQLWAFLTAPGVSGAMSRPTRIRYRRLAAQLGVALAEIRVEEQALPVRVRLDFDSGTEVVHVA